MISIRTLLVLILIYFSSSQKFTNTLKFDSQTGCKIENLFKQEFRDDNCQFGNTCTRTNDYTLETKCVDGEPRLLLSNAYIELSYHDFNCRRIKSMYADKSNYCMKYSVWWQIIECKNNTHAIRNLFNDKECKDLSNSTPIRLFKCESSRTHLCN
jgi:hypothetical protein